MKIGYVRVSTVDQNLDLQIDALKAHGCDEIFEDKLSGIAGKRPGLEKALQFDGIGMTKLVRSKMK